MNDERFTSDHFSLNLKEFSWNQSLKWLILRKNHKRKSINTINLTKNSEVSDLLTNFYLQFFNIFLFIAAESENSLSSINKQRLNEYKFPKPLESYLEKPRPMVGKERKRKEGEDEKDLVSCHLCPRKFSQEYSLRQHCIIVHASHYNCPHCNVAFAVEDVQGFKFHMFRHDLVGKYSIFYFHLEKKH